MDKIPEDINDIGYCMDVYNPDPDSECRDCFASIEGDCPGMINMLERLDRSTTKEGSNELQKPILS